MAWRERRACLVEQLAPKRAGIAGASAWASFAGVGREPGFSPVPGLGADDRRMLAVIGLSLMRDATDIERIAQEFIDMAAAQAPPATHSPVRAAADLG